MWGYVKDIDHAENLWHCESPARENLCSFNGITLDMFPCTAWLYAGLQTVHTSELIKDTRKLREFFLDV
jgi:hypothetical protein